MLPCQMFFNGNVLTMDAKKPEASDFGITGDRFSAVGSGAKLRKSFGKGAKVVDLNGKTVVPGFIESHAHLSDYAMTLIQADCSTPPNRNIEDVIARVNEITKDISPGQWVKGWGYDDTLIDEKRHLTRCDLDKASPKNPVFISHISGHLAYVNSLALEIAGIGPATSQAKDKNIHKDEKGLPTEILMEEAQSLVTKHIPSYSVSQIKDLLGKSIKHYHQAGIASTHDASIGYYGDGREVLKAYRELEAEGKLKLRVYLTIVEKIWRKILELGLGSGFGSQFLKLGGVKFFQDGSIQALTAALTEPYYNKPESRGDLIIAQENLDEFIKKYHNAGFQIAIHANGDRAIESVLQALEKACQAHPRKDHRHMIIHCQLASRDHIRRMKQFGVIPSYFPNHVYYWGDRHLSLFLGPERAQHIDPLGSSVEEGLMFSLHSDNPVTPVNPLFSIHCAVNRTTRNGKILGPEERINPLEALKAYTLHAAYCSFEEHIKGSIEVGKLADFTVLSDNPLTVSPEKIKSINVEATVVGGQIMYGDV